MTAQQAAFMHAASVHKSAVCAFRPTTMSFGLPQCRLECISALTLMQCNDAIGLPTMLVTRHMPVGLVQLVAAV